MVKTIDNHYSNLKVSELNKLLLLFEEPTGEIDEFVITDQGDLQEIGDVWIPDADLTVLRRTNNKITSIIFDGDYTSKNYTIKVVK
jgi:hypothetical protein